MDELEAFKVFWLARRCGLDGDPYVMGMVYDCNDGHIDTMSASGEIVDIYMRKTEDVRERKALQNWLH